MPCSPQTYGGWARYYVPLNDVEIGVRLLDELDCAMSYHIHVLKWSDGSFCYHWSSLSHLGNQRASEWKDDFLSFATSGRLFISDRIDKRELDAVRRDLQPECFANRA